MIILIRWTIFLGLFVFNIGCSLLSSVGPVPKIDTCVVYAFENPNKTWTVQERCKDSQGKRYDKPVSLMNGDICFSQDDYIDGITYVLKVMKALKAESQLK